MAVHQLEERAGEILSCQGQFVLFIKTRIERRTKQEPLNSIRTTGQDTVLYVVNNRDLIRPTDKDLTDKTNSSVTHRVSATDTNTITTLFKPLDLP